MGEKVCNANARGSYNYSTAYKSEYFRSRGRLFTFDMEKSLQSKLCAYKDKVKDLAFGIAAYDIDADESRRACPKVKYTGRYNRLAFLRNLRDFMEKYTNKTDCLSVQ
ncbi:hypothetical protein HPB50_003819 [Hyalomma asiaticum]|uniref:Uncharacterized protein n=1 Tax=Hyalomma asiaticum TaxID=266040 RepID=A0ACB7T7U4_HYAAI|nr:hypothetical protein HPB50_003819 [Hyalomma asiaticum]